MIFSRRLLLVSALLFGFGMVSCDDDSGNVSQDEKTQTGEKDDSLCGNGKIDEGEVCDFVDTDKKEAKLKAGVECKDYDDSKEFAKDGKPGCSKDCKKLTVGTCEEKSSEGDGDLCGNGKIDDGEQCDIGDDKEAGTDDDVFAEGAACKDLGDDKEYREDGKPGCGKGCKLSIGTCAKSIETSFTCGNGVIDEDEGEVCDIGKDTFTGTVDDVLPDDLSCMKLDDSKEYLEGGKPTCSSTCKSFDNGSCRVKSDSNESTTLCGNGVIDEGEICDFLVENGFLTSVLSEDTTCETYEPGKYLKNNEVVKRNGNEYVGGLPKCGNYCMKLEQGDCKLWSELPEEGNTNCGNGKIDDGELCDIGEKLDYNLEGIMDDVFSIEGMTCNDMGVEFKDKVFSDDGKPGCKANCTGYHSGTCKEILCGNGKVDEGEKCDIGIKDENGNRTAVFKDEGPACKDIDPKFDVQNVVGRPGCSDDCQEFTENSCEIQELGLKSCSNVTITADATKATGSVKAETNVQGASFNAMIICDRDSANLKDLLQNAYPPSTSMTGAKEDGTHEGSFNTSNVTGYGSFGCSYLLQSTDIAKVYVCINNKLELAEEHTIGDSKITSYKREGEVIKLAYWDFNDPKYSSEKNKSAIEKIISDTNGMSPSLGDAKKDLRLMWFPVGSGGKYMQIVMTVDAATEGLGREKQKYTAVQFKKNQGGNFIEPKDDSDNRVYRNDTNSHLKIWDFKPYVVKEMQITAKYGSDKEGKLYVTSFDGKTEKLVKVLNFNGNKKYMGFSVTDFPEDASVIRIYANKSQSALTIDDILFVGYKKD